MVKTIPADFFMMFIIGMMLSFGAREKISKEKSPLKNRYLAITLIFVTLLCIPQSIYAYIRYPAWCWMYWLDPRIMSTIGLVSTFLLYLPTCTLGFFLVIKLEERRKGLGLTSIIIGIAAFIIFMLITAKRLFFVGSLDQFMYGQLTPLYSLGSFFWILSCGMILSFVIMVLIYIEFRKETS